MTRPTLASSHVFVYATVLEGRPVVTHPVVLGAEFETLPIWKIS